LGLSRYSGKPHWIKGVAAYGCLAGSIVLNQKTVKTLEEMESLEDPDAIEDAFNRAVQQDLYSEAFAYAAISIWVADIVWNIIGTKELHNRSLSFHAGFDPIGAVPVIRIQYLLSPGP
jgi:hypothetical protein